MHSPGMSELRQDYPGCAKDAMDVARVDESPIFISAVSVVELRYLTEKGTFTEGEYVALLGVLRGPDTPFEVAPMDGAIAEMAGQISRELVADPFDRMIAATSLTLGVPIVTIDRKMRALSALQTIW